jgi:hypothetical protein
MQVRRAASDATAGDSAPGQWWGRRARPAPWLRAALPGRAARAGVDAAALAIALLIATLLRHDGDFHRVGLARLLVLAMVAAAVQTVAGLRFGLYTGRWSYGCF